MQIVSIKYLHRWQTVLWLLIIQKCTVRRFQTACLKSECANTEDIVIYVLCNTKQVLNISMWLRPEWDLTASNFLSASLFPARKLISLSHSPSASFCPPLFFPPLSQSVPAPHCISLLTISLVNSNPTPEQRANIITALACVRANSGLRPTAPSFHLQQFPLASL